jgi:DNA primase
MDSAGQSATLKALDLAIAADLNTQIISLPQGKDPADFLKENQSKFVKLISQAKSVIDYCISASLAKHDISKIEGKKLVAKEVLPRIKQISNQIEKAYWLDQLALTLKTDIAALEAEMKKIPTTANYQLSDSHQDRGSSQNNESIFPLEEFVISIVLTNPKYIEKIKKEPSYIFQNKDLEFIFKKIKDTSQKKMLEISEFKKQLPEKYSAYLDFLLLKAETQIPQDTNIGEEIEFGLTQLKKNHLKMKLAQLNNAIKIAEQGNSAKELATLTAKFNKLSQKIISS